MKNLLFLLFLPLLMQPHGLAGQGTLHLILSVDEVNEDIRQGCMQDRDYLSAVLEMIAEDAGMYYQEHEVGFSPEAAFDFIDYFECGPDDAVVFFYSGHGFREEDDAVIWPFLYYCAKEEQMGGESLQQCGVPLDWVHHMLISKGPRMSITLGNCCNDVPGNVQANEQARTFLQEGQHQSGGRNLNNLELLTRFQGHILASGSSPGQFAYTNDEDGSYFVNGLVDELIEGLYISEEPTSWAGILKRTRGLVQQQKPDQRPQFLIVRPDKKMLFSEGSEAFQYQPSYEQLGLEMPEVGDEEYYEYDDNLEGWDVDGMEDTDYVEEWESGYDDK